LPWFAKHEGSIEEERVGGQYSVCRKRSGG
jgi:hypothetical protein